LPTQDSRDIIAAACRALNVTGSFKPSGLFPPALQK
ncbi:impB domain protein, partial [Shigella sonnei]|nr:impB domain protein [Shigella sonnei]